MTSRKSAIKRDIWLVLLSFTFVLDWSPSKREKETFSSKKSWRTQLLSLCTHSVSVFFFLCFPAVLPYVCPIISLQRLRIRSTHHRGPQMQRITLNTSIHYTVHIHTPVCFVLFPIQGLCQFGPRSPSTARKCLTKQNMSVTGKDWKCG